MCIGITVAHLAVAALLLIAVQKSGVLSTTSSSMPISFLSPADEVFSTEQHSEQSVMVVQSEVAPPNFDIGASNADPFASAAQSPKLQSSFALTAVADRAIPHGELVEAWIADMHKRLANAPDGAALPKPVILEVFAQPEGGFTRARLRQGSGRASVDQELLASIMFQQQLVPAGLVTEPAWLALPEIGPDLDAIPVEPSANSAPDVGVRQ